MIKSWMVIGGVTFLVALFSFLIRPRDIKWVKHLELPKWLLIIEPAIPFIWTVIFICGALSAIAVWEKKPGSITTWLVMGLYLALEIVTVAYVPATVRLRSLAIGTLLGATGAILGVVLTLTVWPISGSAALLLLPYLVWSPIGTYSTKELINLNPESA